MFTTITAAGVAVALVASAGYASARSSDATTDAPGAVAAEQDRDRDRLQLHDPDDCVFDGETGELANRYQVRDRDGVGDGAHLGSDSAPRDGRAQGRG